MEVISQNIANANTTKTDEGGPYRRQMVHFDTMLRNQMKFNNDVSSNNLSEVRASRSSRIRARFVKFINPAIPMPTTTEWCYTPTCRCMRKWPT